MKINKFTLIYKRSIQMRQFEPAEASMSMEVQIDPGDDTNIVINKAKKILRAQVDAEYDRLKDIRFESIDDEKEKAI